MASTYYEILGVTPDADFDSIKKAYYQRAKACHPDRFGGSRDKEEEFKQLVEAFSVLSDPWQRRAYDRHGTTWDANSGGFYFGDDADAILDSHVDDTLEELIVGNNFPDHSSLATLMRDLENTERFCRYREAKNHFFMNRMQKAHELFEQCMRDAPTNILYHYFLGLTYCSFKDWKSARKELETAVQIGVTRRPPLRLKRIHYAIERIKEKQHTKVVQKLRKRFSAKPERLQEPPEERMQNELGRTMDRLLSEEKHSQPGDGSSHKNQRNLRLHS